MPVEWGWSEHYSHRDARHLADMLPEPADMGQAALLVAAAIRDEIQDRLWSATSKEDLDLDPDPLILCAIDRLPPGLAQSILKGRDWNPNMLVQAGVRAQDFLESRQKTAAHP